MPYNLDFSVYIKETDKIKETDNHSTWMILTFRIQKIICFLDNWSHHNLNTSSSNSGFTSPPRWLPYYLFLNLHLYFLFMSYLLRITLPYFPSMSSQASLPFYLVVIGQQQGKWFRSCGNTKYPASISCVPGRNLY